MPLETSGAGTKRALSNIFSLDLRSLALLRVGLGALLLIDLGYRLFTFETFYTADGVLPVALARALPERLSGHLSLHLLSDSAFFQGVLFAIAALLALALLLGWRTRLSTLGCWLMLLSLYHRNPLVVYGANDLMLACLFWGIFLPLGRYGSLDSISRKRFADEKSSRIFSAATVGMFIQILLIYWTAAFSKLGGGEWPYGTGFYRALMSPAFATRQGLWLLTSLPAPILEALNFLVIIFEVLLPLTLLIPFRAGRIRTVGVLLFCTMHLLFGSFLTLYLFPWAGALQALAFLPSEFWDRKRTFDAQQDRDLPRPGQWLAAFFAVHLVWYGVSQCPGKPLKEPSGPWRSMAWEMKIKPRWSLFTFAKDPDGYEHYLVFVGYFKNGAARDLLSGDRLSGVSSRLLSERLTNANWKAFFTRAQRVPKKERRVLFESAANTLYRQWDRRARNDGERVRRVELVGYLFRQPPMGWKGRWDPKEKTWIEFEKEYVVS